jgi:hypothetical protein
MYVEKQCLKIILFVTTKFFQDDRLVKIWHNSKSRSKHNIKVISKNLASLKPQITILYDYTYLFFIREHGEGDD